MSSSSYGRLDDRLDAALQALLGGAAVELLDRLPAGAVPERHRVAAVGVLERDAEELADAREAVARVLDEVRAEADLVAAVLPVARAAAERALALDERDLLALLREHGGRDEPGRAGADDRDVDLHDATAASGIARARMIRTVSGWSTLSSSNTWPVGVLAVDEAPGRVAADRLHREARPAAGRLDPRERLRHVVDRDREVHDPDGRSAPAAGSGRPGRETATARARSRRRRRGRP